MYPDDLRRLFGTFGPINAAKVMVDKVTGESIQIGFVRYLLVCFYFTLFSFSFSFSFFFFLFSFFFFLFLFPLTGHIFENQEDATKALTTMNGQKLVDDQPPVHGINSSFVSSLASLHCILCSFF